ncbi:uncharacterized protein Dana_GF21630 [Drosophila ananassae]|uniref:Uncharacterized protein n=1 Tax=Drosophila ananassae TaxID=7217 RepID=B3MVD0_DROAN|nr:uncharacterized protein LOC6504303 [Drosophila ananassae]EDV33195.1 uncharacterized protein Dana_GF21630 [Drosophila ananassae]
MACSGPPHTAIVVNLLIGDLVQDAVNEPFKLSEQTSTCRRLFHILGFTPADVFEDDDEPGDGNSTDKSSSCTLRNIPNPNAMNIKQRNWHSWMKKALAEENSEDDIEIFKRSHAYKVLETTGVQTEQPRLRRKEPGAVPVDVRQGGQPGEAPCEMTRQTIFIEAVSVPIPNVLARAPLADRFCYMLTDFASALYCSLAIMCCCTPNMLR